jgi:hypothetical protein
MFKNEYCESEVKGIWVIVVAYGWKNLRKV